MLLREGCFGNVHQLFPLGQIGAGAGKAAFIGSDGA